MVIDVHLGVAAGLFTRGSRTRRINKKNNNNNNKNNSKRNALTRTKILSAVSSIVKPAVKQALIKTGGGLGGMVGGQFGMPGAGKHVGSMLGARLSKIVGSGDYTINSTPAYNSLIKGARDFPGTFGTGGIRLQFREYIGDVTAINNPSGFNVTSYTLNPGLFQSFPYLSQLALNYEQYTFHGLAYEYVSTTSPYSTVPNMGSVVIAHESNPDRKPYVSKFEMENSENAISTRIDNCMMYGVECADARAKGFLVRGSTLSIGTLSPYDFGNLYVATVGVQNSGALGELWVTYDVELSRPRLSSYITSIMKYSAIAFPVGNPVFGSIGVVTNATAKLVGTTVGSSPYSGNAFKKQDCISFPQATDGDTIVVTLIYTSTDSPTVTKPSLTVNTSYEPSIANGPKFNIVGGGFAAVNMTGIMKLKNETTDGVYTVGANPTATVVLELLVAGTGVPALYASSCFTAGTDDSSPFATVVNAVLPTTGRTLDVFVTSTGSQVIL